MERELLIIIYLAEAGNKMQDFETDSENPQSSRMSSYRQTKKDSTFIKNSGTHKLQTRFTLQRAKHRKISNTMWKILTNDNPEKWLESFTLWCVC